MTFDFFSITTEINTLLWFQKSYCLWLAITIAVSLPRHYQLRKPHVVMLYGPPEKLLGRIHIPSLNSRQQMLCGIVFCLSLTAAALGIAVYFCLFVSLLLYVLYFSQLIPFEDVGRKTHHIPAVLGVLLMSPNLQHSLSDPNVYWPQALIKFILAHTYFSAAYQKLRYSGFAWPKGDSFRNYLIVLDLWHGLPKAKALLNTHRSIITMISSSVVIFQVTFWMILFWPSLDLIYAICGLCFHTGIWLVMKINYLKYISGIYLIFLIELLNPWLATVIS